MRTWFSLALWLGCGVVASAQSAAHVEFFEKKIRPLFHTHCLECHGAEGKKVKGGLRLTTRAELLAGGDTGPAFVVGKPEQSLLIKAVHYRSDDVKMPPKGRLKDSEIADLETWIKDGAAWPATSGSSTNSAKTGPLFTEEQKRFWAFQPMLDSQPPTVKNRAWVQSPIDAFLLAKLEERALTPAKPTDKYTLLRRVTFDLTGLPPTPAEIAAFLKDTSPTAFATVVDRLLQSPRYGERWGRHWLDVARYADSNGLDENTAFGNAWRYRDYVIKSFNDDKPYHTFLREQIAGDLLPDAGTNPDRLTATGFLVLGPKLLAEPDKQKMKMDIADEQLDTLGKAVLGLTIGCARCHDHKFDPLPQRDYYSLLGTFTSTRTMKGLGTVAQAYERALPSGERPEAVAARDKQRAAKEAEIKQFTEELRAQILTEARAKLAQYLLAAADAQGRSTMARLNNAAKIPGALVQEAEKYRKGNADKDTTTYGKDIGVIISYNATHKTAEYLFTVPKTGEYELELRYAALESRPVRIALEGKVLFPEAAKATTGGWNPEHQAWHAIGRVPLKEGRNTLSIEGVGLLPHIDKLAILPVVTGPDMLGGPRPSAGTPTEVARQRTLVAEFVEGWQAFLRTAKPDDPLWGAWLAAHKLPDAGFADGIAPILAKFPTVAAWVDKKPLASLNDLANAYARHLGTTEVGKKLVQNPAGPFALKTPLPANPESLYPMPVAKLSTLNNELQAILKAAPPTVMVLAVDEGAKYGEVKGDGKPRNLFVQVRGNYLTPGEEAPPVFPRILAGEQAKAFTSITADLPKSEANQTRYGSLRASSGRLELAEWITHDKHPLTARVWVNRVWQHHFGEGLVRSPDNFGKLGEAPTHPALLDWLALRFIEQGYSTKKLHRLMLLSSAYQMSTTYDERAAQIDPDNRLLARFPRLRLEAEPIRDALLFVGGNIDLTMGGTLLNNGNFTYVNNENSTNTARYDNHRRSVYLPVIRNNVFDFFQVFDFAEPHVANGKRASTVVAQQALFLMNSPFALAQAKAFATAVTQHPGDDTAKVQQAYLKAYGRPATAEEVRQALAYLTQYEQATPTKSRPGAWQSFCQVLFASSEFVYLN